MTVGFVFFCSYFMPNNLFANESTRNLLIVADFNSGHKPNNLGQEWGSWNFDPNDPEQGFVDAIETDDFQSKSGFCIRMDYDVQSSKPAFNGFWMKLGNLDATPYEWFSFYVKGQPNGQFTKRFKFELKNAKGERAVYLANALSMNWQQIRVPFKKNQSIQDWSQLIEFVIVFDDILVTYKKGTLFLDEIEFQK